MEGTAVDLTASAKLLREVEVSFFRSSIFLSSAAKEVVSVGGDREGGHYGQVC